MATQDPWAALGAVPVAGNVGQDPWAALGAVPADPKLPASATPPPPAPAPAWPPSDSAEFQRQQGIRDVAAKNVGAVTQAVAGAATSNALSSLGLPNVGELYDKVFPPVNGKSGFEQVEEFARRIGRTPAELVDFALTPAGAAAITGLSVPAAAVRAGIGAVFSTQMTKDLVPIPGVPGSGQVGRAAVQHPSGATIADALKTAAMAAAPLAHAGMSELRGRAEAPAEVPAESPAESPAEASVPEARTIPVVAPRVPAATNLRAIETAAETVQRMEDGESVAPEQYNAASALIKDYAGKDATPEDAIAKAQSEVEEARANALSPASSTAESVAAAEQPPAAEVQEAPLDEVAAAPESPVEPPASARAPEAVPPEEAPLPPAVAQKGIAPEALPEQEGSTIPADAGNAPDGSPAEARSLPEPRQPSYPVAQGSATQIPVPGREVPYQATYSVRELDDVVPSHKPFSFAPDERYHYLNDRDYTKPSAQLRVTQNSGGKFDPSYLVTDNPDSTNGPPIIEQNGNVLGGNNRTMTLARVYSGNPKGAEAYRAMLVRKAASFGVDPEAVRNMRQPVLVREMSEEDLDPQRAITDLNKSPTAALSQSEQSTADARSMSSATARSISRILDGAAPDASLNDVLTSKHGPYMVNQLIKEGIFTEAERPSLIDDNTGAVTKSARDRISKMLLGDLFENNQQFEGADPSLRNKLEKVVASLKKVEGDPDWDLSPAVRKAIAGIEYEKEYRKAHGFGPEDPRAKNQVEMFDTSRPEATPESERLKKFIQENNPRAITKAFREYADSRANVTMFEPASPQESFDKAFGSDRTRGAPESTELATAQPIAHPAARPLDVPSARGPESGSVLASSEPEPTPLSTLDRIEQEAKARIAQRWKEAGRTLSAGPGLAAEQLADYSLVGAVKIAKGAVRFSSWAHDMTQEFGEAIRPYLGEIWMKAQGIRARELADTGESGRPAAEVPVEENIPVAEAPQTPPPVPAVAHSAATPLSDLTKAMGVKPMSEGPSAMDQAARNVSRTLATASDRASRAWNAVQVAPSALWKAYASPAKWTDFKSEVGKFQGQLQYGGWELKQFRDAIKTAIPDKLRREAMTNFVQADGDMDLLRQRAAASSTQLRPGYEAALTLNPAEAELAKNVRRYFDQKLDEAQTAGMLKDGVENYVNQVWGRGPENPAAKTLRAAAAFHELQPNPSFLKQRIFGSYFDGEQAGKSPLDKDIGALISAYDQSFNAAVASRAFIKALHEGKASDGRPLVEVSGVGSRVEATPDDVAYFIKPKVKPEAALDYRPVDHPALRGWKWATADKDGKPIFVQGDMLVHPEVQQHLKNILGRSAIREHALGRGLLALSSGFKQTLLSLSPFHQVQIGVHALEHTVNPFRVPALDLKDATQRALVDHGLVVADFHGMAEFAEGVSGTGLVSRVPLLGSKMAQYQDYLFRDYIPRVKMSMAQEALARNLKRYSGKISQDQILERTANEANAAFGHLNYKLLGRNPTFQDAFRIFALAPDFLEARSRFVGQALKPGGMEQARALALGAVAMAAGKFIIGQVIGEKQDWTTNNLFMVRIGNREYGLRTIQGDIAHLLGDPRSFVSNRFNPALTRPAMELVTGRDSFGRKRDSWEQLKDYFTTAIPIPAKGLLPDNPQGFLSTLMQATGLQGRKYLSPAERVLQGYYNDNPGKSPTAHSKAVGQVVKMARTVGAPQAQRLGRELVSSGQIDAADLRRALHRGNESALESGFAGLPLDKATEVYEAATPEERAGLLPTLRMKARNAAGKPYEFTPSVMEQLTEEGVPVPRRFYHPAARQLVAR